MNGKQKQRRETFPCPHCGAEVAVGAKVCRACGSDADTGWQDEATIEYTSVDLPDGHRDGGSDELPPARLPRWVVVTALLMAVLLVAAVTRGFGLL